MRKVHHFARSVAAEGHELEQTRAARERMLRLLRRLASEPGFALGQQDTTAYGGCSGDTDRSDVQSLCGSHVALYGWDLFGIEKGSAKNGDGVDFEHMRRSSADAHRRGGLNTISGWLTHDSARLHLAVAIHSRLPARGAGTGLARGILSRRGRHGKIPTLTEFGARGGLNGAGVDPRCIVNDALVPLLSSPVATRIAYALARRNARVDHCFLPYPGHPGAATFQTLCGGAGLALEQDLRRPGSLND